MVALSSSTVARSGVSMVAWTIGVVFFVLSNVQAVPDIKYGGDVSGDEVVIDQLEDYIRSHGTQHLYAPSGDQPRRYQQKLKEKIKFGVTPHDPRYYDTVEPVEGPPDTEARFRPYLPPNLAALGAVTGIESQPQYPSDVNQYQDEDAQYPSNQYVQDQYPDQFPFRDPGYPEVGRPEVPFYGNPRLEELERLQEMRGIVPDGRQEPLPQPMMPMGFREEQEGEEEDRDESKRMRVPGEDGGGELGGGSPSHSATGAGEGEKNKKAAVKASAATSQPEAVNYLNRSPAHAQNAGYVLHEADPHAQLNDIYFTAIVAGCTAAAVCAVIGAGMCWYRLNKSHRAAQDAEYPAYGVTGPNKDLSPSSGDRKLAQSAHMYHYQHQKQQMIALEKSSGAERHGSASDVDSEEEGEENEYTVYECPGLAPTGEMEVKNPLFHDDPTPATPSMRKDQEDEDEEDEDEEEQKAK
ncbi:protein cab-1 isoform X1 [Macrobrachium rosenbergii]|uniref:protein cab-1 isoform X1 n=1 Tax=Macrobrachium rosenbergii TaxID=79674 RepID=UPI0034D45031